MPGNRSKETAVEENPSAGPSAPDLDPASIRHQLERILLSTPFRNSKRYPALLRYVVEKHLNGTSSELKERTIGIDVFGRDPYYDPGVDPVVRVSAGEVRKRLAQYYQDAGSARELRIELPVGSYQPEFARPAVPVTVPVATPLVDEPLAVTVPRRPFTVRQVFGWLGLAVVLLFVASAAYRWMHRPTALDLFWRPVLQQSNSVMLCLGHTTLGATSQDATRPKDPVERAVVWWDAKTLALVAGLVASKGASIGLFNEDEATFSDFQQRPAVLIGAFNDRWTMEWMEPMRYTFQHEGHVSWIADRDRPAFRGWKVDLNQKDAQGFLVIQQDYAIISRVANPRTGFITVTAAGLWGYGTMAAGRFLTDPKFLADFAKQNHLPLDKGDLQIVIGTEVIQGKPGPPRVLAVASW